MRSYKSFILLCLSLASASAEPSLTVSNKDYASGSTANELAEYTLSTSGSVIVRTGADVKFTAGSSITLYSGFTAQAGSTFKAAVSSSLSYNPGSFYNAVTPSLVLIAGDQQYGQVGAFNLLPFDIAVWNQAGTAPLVNAPVLITVSSGGGWISSTNAANAVLAKTLQLTTDGDGTVRVYFKQGTSELVTSSIKVIAGTANWQFTSFSYSSTGVNADTDADGVSNTAETLLGMNATQPSQPSTGLGLVVFTP